MSCYFSQGKIQTDVGILSVDNQRRIVSINRKFIEMWRIPKPIIDARDGDSALEFVSKQFEKPERFFKEVQELNKQTQLEISDIIKFKDGRVVECYSQPQWLEDKYVGRVWMCREITSVIYLNNLNLVSNKILRFPEIYQVDYIRITRDDTKYGEPGESTGSAHLKPY